jgi:energy-coupling factor transporter ATP-binding protein EcfA2
VRRAFGERCRIDTAGVLTTATELRELLARTELPLATETAADARAAAHGVVRQLDDYVLPRLRDIDAPVLAVVGGSTGSGKSTLVNSLLGVQVSTPGVLRPTTRSPVLVHHPRSSRWFEGDRVLGSLARVRGGQAAGPNQLELVSSDVLPENLALLDAPDIDSVLDLNRAVAGHLLAAADLWVFVTTAARYADAVPWEFLRGASQRGVGVGLVLNRVPAGAAALIAPDLSRMLSDEGLGGAPLFVVEEQPLGEGRLPADAIAPVRRWLGELAADGEARAALVRRSLGGAVADIAERTRRVAATVDHQAGMAAWLEQRASEPFELARTRLAEDVRDGTVMRGEVLARWQELVGTGELLRELQSKIGRARDRITAAVTGRPRAVDRFQGAVESGVEILVRERVAEACERAALVWRSVPAGATLLEASRVESTGVELSQPSADLPERTTRLVRDWQGALLELLREEGSGKRTVAKVLSYGVNGAALVLMVGVFAHTGGLTGAEVAIAGGSTAVGTTLLEALLGDQVVRQLAERAREDLDQRTGALLASECDRFRAVLDRHRPDEGAGARLGALADELSGRLAR